MVVRPRHIRRLTSNGNDTANYQASLAAVTVSLLTGAGAGGDAQGDTLSFIENLRGSNLGDTLTGDGGGNILLGMAGNDVLKGGGGKDTLTGGLDADRFVFAALADSAVGVNRDLISDFNKAQGDRIDLSAIAGLSFGGAGAFSGAAGEIRFSQSAGQTIIGIDSDGNGTANMEIALTGLFNLTAAEFIL